MKEDYTAASTFPSKLLHNKVIKDGKIVPIHLQLIPTNACNQTCSFCSCSDRRKGLELSLEKMKGILNVASQLGTKALTITGGGEPLMHKDLNEMIRYAAERGIECGLTTNGKLLDRLEEHKNLTWCRISTSDEQTPAYDKISKAVNLNKETDWAFSYVLSKDPNYQNLQNTINFANKLDFTHIRLVSDLFDLDNVPDMDKVRLRLENDRKVIYQGRKDNTRGNRDCYISLLKPLISPEGVFPCCLHPDESILIDKEGSIIPKKISEVKKGEIAYGNGKILNKFTTKKDKALKIVLNNGRQLIVSNDHIMLKAENIKIKEKRKKILKSFDLKEIKAEDLKKGDLIPVKYNLISKEKIKSESFPLLFLYGTYIAEGYCSKDRINSYLCLGLHEIGKKDKIISILIENNIKFHIYKRRTTWQISIANKELKEKFLKFGRVGKEKRIADYIFELPDTYKEELLYNYWLGDGNLAKPIKYRDGYSIIFSTISKKLASDIIILLSTLGIIGTIHESKRDKMIIEGREVNCHNIFRVKVSGKYNFDKLKLDWGIKNLNKKRSPKRAKGFLKSDELMLVPIKKIENVEGGDFIDIQVKGTNMFYSSFGILTHNCGIQYAINGQDKDLIEELSMGSIEELADIVTNQRKFNGKVCDVCYYSQYNEALKKLKNAPKHERFV